LCLLPVFALAAIEPSDGVDRNGSLVRLSGNYEEYTISGIENNVSIIVESGIKALKLNNASISAPKNQDALMAEGSLQLHLIGTSSIIGGSGDSDSTYAQDGRKGIVLPAGGVLTISGEEGSSLSVKGGAGGSYSESSDTNGKAGRNGGTAIEASVTLSSGTLKAYGGKASNGMQAAYRVNAGVGGAAISGDAYASRSVRIKATGGAAAANGAEGGTNTGENGVNGSAVVNDGRLTATGGGASKAKKNNGGSGVNGAFTAVGGYALVKGGSGSTCMGKAAASTEAFPVVIGSSEKWLAASVGEGESPDTPLNGGAPYSAAVNETDHVSGKRSLETKEHFAVVYVVCAYDGCEDSYTDYAEGNKTYTVKTPEALGFQNHGLAFAGFADESGNAADSLTVSGPMILKGSWKVVFTFDAGEGGANPAPPVDVITSGSTIRLPECGMAAPAGHRFVGWKLEGDDQIYAAGDEVPAAREIRLTAVWERIPVPPATGDCAMPILWLLLCLGSCGLLLRERARN